MKKCPTCGRLFPDASLNFCRMDGTRLVDMSVRSDEALTIQLRHKRHIRRKNDRG